MNHFLLWYYLETVSQGVNQLIRIILVSCTNADFGVPPDLLHCGLDGKGEEGRGGHYEHWKFEIPAMALQKSFGAIPISQGSGSEITVIESNNIRKTLCSRSVPERFFWPCGPIDVGPGSMGTVFGENLWVNDSTGDPTCNCNVLCSLHSRHFGSFWKSHQSSECQVWKEGSPLGGSNRGSWRATKIQLTVSALEGFSVWGSS